MTTDLHQTLHAARAAKPQVRLRAAMRLYAVADETVGRELVDLLVQEADPFVRETLTWVIVAHEGSTMPHLLAALRGNGPARAQVLHALSKIQDPDCLELVVPLVHDPDPMVAAKAWWVLGRMAAPAAGEMLVALLGRQDDPDRKADLTRALQHLGEPAVPLVAAKLGSEDAAVRRHAAEVLVAVGEPAAGAFDALVDAAHSEDRELAVLAMEALVPLDLDRVDDVLRQFRDGGNQWLATVADWYLSERESLRARAERIRERVGQR